MSGLEMSGLEMVLGRKVLVKQVCWSAIAWTLLYLPAGLPGMSADASVMPMHRLSWQSAEQVVAKKQETVQENGDRATCPDQLQTLVPLLLRDLPSYTNRVTQRAARLYRDQRRSGYVLLAGRPEYESLPTRPGESITTQPDAPAQVFFTTLERQYVNGKAVQIQHFHWLFLAKAPDRWYFVLMQSSLGNAPEQPDRPPTPPEDSSEGAIAQAIRLWLRDCAVGRVRLN